MELLSRFCESLLAEVQAEVVAMSFACALGLFCVLRSDVALPIYALQADTGLPGRNRLRLRPPRPGVKKLMIGLS